MAKTETKKIQLGAQPRNVFGKNLRKFKYQGLIAGNIFGVDFTSKAVTLNLKDFMPVYKQAKETGVIYIQVDKDEIPVLIRQIQYHPVENRILHVDFRKINLRQKLETDVPVQIIGESIAVSQKGGVLLTQSDHLLIEALPQDIPQYIEVDITSLTEIGGEIKVSDLPKSDAYEIKEDVDKVIVSVTEHKEESITPETEQAAPEITAEKPEEAGEDTVEENKSTTEEKEEK